MIAAVVELADENGRVSVGTVGDERLVAIENVVVAIAPRASLHAAERVRPRIRFGDRPGADLLHRQKWFDPTLLLGQRPLRHDGVRRQSDTDAHRGDHSRAVATQLDDRNQSHAQGVAAAFAAGGAALFARFLAFDLLAETSPRHLVDAERSEHLAQDVVRRHVAVLEVLDVGFDLRLDELPHGVLDHCLLFVPLDHLRAPPESRNDRAVSARGKPRGSYGTAVPTAPWTKPDGRSP